MKKMVSIILIAIGLILSALCSLLLYDASTYPVHDLCLFLTLGVTVLLFGIHLKLNLVEKEFFYNFLFPLYIFLIGINLHQYYTKDISFGSIFTGIIPNVFMIAGCIIGFALKRKFCQDRPLNDVSQESWIGVDLDGTLAEYSCWEGSHHIGEAVTPMVDRVRQWLDEGKKVKIFTARATEGPTAVGHIHDWLEKQGLPRLEVTNVKDYAMLELWDDRCVAIETNRGIPRNNIQQT